MYETRMPFVEILKIPLAQKYKYFLLFIPHCYSSPLSITLNKFSKRVVLLINDIISS